MWRALLFLLAAASETRAFHGATCHDPAQHDGSHTTPPCLNYRALFASNTPGAQHRAAIRQLPYSAGLPAGARGMSAHSRLIVIANCNEDLAWLREATTERVPLAVYDKCHADGAIALPEPLRVETEGVAAARSAVTYRTRLNNTGEECSAYLRFIVDHYDDLPDLTFFLQGSPIKHSPYITWIVEHLRRDLDFVSLSNLYVGYNETGEPNSPLGTLLVDFMPKFFDLKAPNVMGTYCCGMFAASRRGIRARPLNFWKQLLSLADGSMMPSYVPNDWRRRHEAGLFERIWMLAFGEEPLQYPYLPFANRWRFWGNHGFRFHLHPSMLTAPIPEGWLVVPNKAMRLPPVCTELDDRTFSLDNVK